MHLDQRASKMLLPLEVRLLIEWQLYDMNPICAVLIISEESNIYIWILHYSDDTDSCRLLKFTFKQDRNIAISSVNIMTVVDMITLSPNCCSSLVFIGHLNSKLIYIYIYIYTYIYVYISVWITLKGVLPKTFIKNAIYLCMSKFTGIFVWMDKWLHRLNLSACLQCVCPSYIPVRTISEWLLSIVIETFVTDQIIAVIIF